MNLKNKFILDACCGPRMFWFNKNNPNAIYIDIRKEDAGYIKSRRFREIKPDKIMDFRDLKFKDKSFKLVVWDPPHRYDFGKNSIMAKNYGILKRETWQWDIKKGFDECMRVLDDYGILIFKWGERHLKVDYLIKIFKQEPLFGHPSKSNNQTHWFCFMKIPNNKK